MMTTKEFINRLLERRAAIWPPALYLVVLFAIPLVVMGVASFQVAPESHRFGSLSDEVAGKSALNFTAEAYRRVVADPAYLQLFINSFAYALATTLICALLAYPVALTIAHAPKNWRNRLLLLAILPLWSCILVSVYAWLSVLGPHSGNVTVADRDLGPLAVMVCLVYVHLPLMIWPLAANLRNHDPLVLDAAQDCGANAARRFWQITFPMSLPGLFIGAAMVFIPAFGAFAIPDLLGGSRGMMTGNLIGQQFLIVHDWSLGSVLVIMIVVVSVAVAGLAKMLVWRTRYE